MTKVLIIEDDRLVSEVYTEVLKAESFEVLNASNGPSGITMAKEQLPDVILLDVMMPNMDGLEVLKRLKSDNTTDLIPVIVLTNVGTDQVQTEALSLGAVRYIVKTDVSNNELVKAIKDYLPVKEPNE